MKKFMNEFKEFALKGNMFDMAIGVIMGAAVSKVVSSIVSDLVTPLITLISGGTTALTDKMWVVNGAEFKYGLFLSNVIDFFMTALIIFLMVKGINKVRNLSLLKKQEEEKAAPKPEISSTDKLLTEILEELKKQH